MALLVIPNNFSGATLLSAAAMNANFTAIATLINTTLLSAENIQNGSITSASIANNAITTAKLADASVTSAKITDASVTTAKLADRLSSTTPTTAGTVLVGPTLTSLTVGNDVAGATWAPGELTKQIVTTGRPLVIRLQGGTVRRTAHVSPDLYGIIGVEVLSGTTVISGFSSAIDNTSNISQRPLSAVGGTLTAPAGTYTIRCFAQLSNTTTAVVYINNCQLVAYEV